ncbi:MAG: prolyl oligopeptidase family serine peptidase [Alphaproteobacteria bacterium]|nr:prolyl oligopeptidase family serine peptidase [Alphaproteobacteria bacterium]
MSAMIGMTTTKATPVLDQPLTAPLPARSGTKVITPDWLLSTYQENTERPVVRWLDNTQLLYAYPPKQNNQEWTIELFNVHTGERKVLVEGANPTPSPDSQWIAFTRGKKESKQLWIMDFKGKNAKQLSHIKGGLGDYYQFSFDFAWSPDSKTIALSHQPDVPYWGKEPQLKSTIDIIDIKTEHTKLITSFDAGIRYLSWFPNGEELLFMKERIGFLYKEEEDREWIQALRIKDRSLRTLAEFDGLQQSLRPTLSPDGKLVAVMYDADNPMFNHMTSLGLVVSDPSNGKEKPPIKRLTYELQLYSPQWSQDSQRIYVRRDYGAYRQIYAIDTKTGEPTQITNAPLNIENYALSPDGSQLAWIGQDAQATRVLRLASSDGRNVKDLAIISGTPKDMALSEVLEVDWKVPDYPSPMRGLLFMPLNYHQGTHYPLIVDVHGGGTGASIHLGGAILLSTPLEWHMWAAKGYVVFVPELRSSASFGSLAITRDDLKDHDLINCDIKDIEAGVDSLIAQGIVDPQRLAVIGHSAGGRRVNWLTATTHRFKAVISKEGWADEWFESLDELPSKRIYQMFGGAPWEVPQNYQKNSALFHCLGATTPTLFLMGNPDLGGVDRYKTVHMLYNALKGQGVETEYVKYDDEGHIFEKPKNQKDSLERAIKWIDGHMRKF